jgi:hypothetical protein
MRTYTHLPHYLFRDNKKLGYNRGFDTLAKARKFAKSLKDRIYGKPLTQIRKVKLPGSRKAQYAVYSTWY